jgi:hypothetical protein
LPSTWQTYTGHFFFLPICTNDLMFLNSDNPDLTKCSMEPQGPVPSNCLDLYFILILPFLISFLLPVSISVFTWNWLSWLSSPQPLFLLLTLDLMTNFNFFFFIFNSLENGLCLSSGFIVVWLYFSQVLMPRSLHGFDFLSGIHLGLDSPSLELGCGGNGRKDEVRIHEEYLAQFELFRELKPCLLYHLYPSIPCSSSPPVSDSFSFKFCHHLLTGPFSSGIPLQDVSGCERQWYPLAKVSLIAGR